MGMGTMALKRLGRRGNAVKGFLLETPSPMVGVAWNPSLRKPPAEGNLGFLKHLYSSAPLREGCRLHSPADAGNVVPFSLPFAFPIRGLQTQAQAMLDACEQHVHEDVEIQAAASVLQNYLQKTSKAYLSDAAAVVEHAPLFVKHLADLTKKKSQEPVQVVEDEADSTTKKKKKKQSKVESAQQAGPETDFSKQVQAFLSTTVINALEPVLESVGITSERLQALLLKFSAETVDVQSLLFVIRMIQKLGISRSNVGDMIEKDSGVLSYTSDEIETGFHTLKGLMISEEEVLGLIQRYPLILKTEFVNNIASLAEELNALSSKDVIITKAVCDNPRCVHEYSRGCAKAVVQYLKSYDFSEERLNHILQKHFRLVFIDVEKKLKCNVQFLKDLGISRELIAKVLNRCPNFLFYSLEDNLMKRVEYFKSLGFDEAEFAKVISRYPNIFSASLENKIKPAIAELRTLGLTEEGLKKVVLYRPSLFAYKLGGDISTLVKGLKETNYSENKVVTAFIKLYSRGVDHRKKCENCLVQHGLSVSEAKAVLDKEPGILGYNEKALAVKIDNLTKTLGIPIQNVVTVPEYLSFGLRKRVLRRQRVLSYMKSKGLLTDALTLKQLVSPSNNQFYNNFVKPNPEDQELSKIWFKNRDGVGKMDGLDFMVSSTKGSSKAQVNS